MSLRTELVYRRKGVSLDDVQKKTKLVFNLQKICLKTSDSSRTMWLLGVDENGYSVSVAVQDFKPTFMIRAPDEWDDDDETAAEELLEMIDEINNKTRISADENRIDDAEFVYMTPFIGFTNGRKDRMVKFVCNSILDFQAVKRYMENQKHPAVTLYHEDFAIPNQFFHQTSIEYQTWLEIPIRNTSSRQTHTSMEVVASMETLTKYNGPLTCKAPPLVKMFIRMLAISRDGVQKNKPAYRCDANQPFDRLVAISVAYTWNDDHTNSPFRVMTFSIIPNFSAQSMYYSTEKDMMDAVRQEIVNMDPDAIFFFPDQFPPFEYFATRINLLSSNGGALKMERFKSSKVRVIKQAGVVENVRFETRNMFNMEAALQKKVFISVESYDLYTCSCHKDFRKKPAILSELITDLKLSNRVIHKRNERYKLAQVLEQDINLLVALEADTSMYGEYSNVSKASDTDLTDVVSRGEQIRVFNKLTHFNMDYNSYINREKLGLKPLKFKASERPPTFKDPEDLPINLKIREESSEYLKSKLAFHHGGQQERKGGSDQINLLDRLFKDEKDEKEEEEEDEETKKHAKDGEEAEGGNVMKPACKFWDLDRVCVYDFASLYPSIMMAFNISYENLVFDVEYLDLPGIEYITIPINKYETVVSANVPGIIPKMLRTFVDNRTSIKKKMKTETDPFRQKALDFEQNSMKILCNGTYGFCGAEKRGALLALKPIMYMVTALGRYLQKTLANYIGIKYKIATIYGDTDSLFTLIPLPANHESMEMSELVSTMSKMYEMDEFFVGQDYPEKQAFTWKNLLYHFATKRKFKLDVNVMKREHQINAVYYLISEKLCEELTHHINRPPVSLEFENLANKVWMGWVKKHYMYLFWDTENPSKVKKIKITGMPVKKREWSPFTRSILMGVTERILYDRTSEIETYLKSELNRLVDGKVPMRDLMVSKGFKTKSAYKHWRQIHLQVMIKIEERTRWPVKDKSRIYYVVTTGTDKLYKRSETPEYAEEHKLEIDMEYYLRNQFEKPMRKLLTYHPELFNFEDVFKFYSDKLKMKQSNITDINTFLSNGNVKRKVMTHEDLLAKNSKTESEADQKRRKAGQTCSISGSVDPFAKFVKKK